MQALKRKEDLSDSLCVSLATVNNWIKTSIIPPPDLGNNYSEKIYNEIVEKIKNSSIKLIGRANRSRKEDKYITYLGIKDKNRMQILEKVIAKYEESGLSIHEGVIALSISMLIYNNLFIKGSVIYNNVFRWIEEINSNIEKMSLFFDIEIPNMDDDFIGAFYQSIQSISSKSTIGSYYTPSELLTNIKVECNKKIIDPCCGSGGILLKVLSKSHNPSLIYARDIDPIALQICKVNLVLFFNDPNIAANISYQDFIFSGYNEPWKLGQKNVKIRW